jgi:hypothetical protein
MIWRREPHDPNTLISSSALVESVLGVVCLASSPRGIMSGPRPDGKREPGFLAQVLFIYQKLPA